jgi:hypothetical protein
MVWFCPACGNQEEFHGTRRYLEWGNEDIRFDGEGEITDWGDRDSTDSEGGEWADETCSRCEAPALDLDWDELILIKKEKGWELTETEKTRVAELEMEIAENEKAQQIDWKDRIKRAIGGKKNVRI